MIYQFVILSSAKNPLSLTERRILQSLRSFRMTTSPFFSLAQYRVHGQGRMSFLLQEGENRVFGDSHRFIGNLIEEVGHAQFFSSRREAFSNLLLQYFGHPDHA